MGQPVRGDLLLSFGYSGVAGYERASRRRLWSTGKSLNGRLFRTRPACHGGMLVVSEGFIGHHIDGDVHAIDLATGRTVWTVSGDEVGPDDDEASTLIFPAHTMIVHDRVWVSRTPLIAGGVVHAATAGGELRGIDAATGALLWTLGLEDGCDATEPEDEFTERATPFTVAGDSIVLGAGSAIVSVG
ncbi:MAG TPA: PQQ-binding-like beta-propeller repeat protein [Candidatus Limnocylindrales bacterium]